MKKRDKLFKLYRNESDPILKATKHNNSKIARNSIISKMKESKKQSYQHCFQKHSTNIKKTWDGIKSIVTLKAKAKTSPISLTLNGVTITNKKSIVETFNNFFVNIGSNLASKILKEKYPFNKYLKHKEINSFFLNPVQENEIKKINNLSLNKSTGPYSILTKILKNHIDVFEQSLSYLINLSFRQVLFPESLKSARVTPVYKKDDPEIPSNYRPILILSVFSKLYEKCMHLCLYSFLLKSKILFNRQFGFRNNYLTNHALIDLVVLIKKYLDNDCYVCGVFIDHKRHLIL